MNKQTLGFVGFGGFGKLAARHLAPYFDICAYDAHRSNSAMDDLDDVNWVDFQQVSSCEIIVLAVPVSAIKLTCLKLAPLLRPGTIVVDVGSVKMSPISDMIEALPSDVQIIGTHPLFGPQSAALGITGLKIALCPVRGDAWRRLRVFLARQLRLKVFTCRPDEHDKEAAIVQGLTHLIAKVLTEMEPLPTRMTTASFDLLVQAINMVKDDPPAVLNAIEMANPFAENLRNEFFEKAETLKERFESKQRYPAE